MRTSILVTLCIFIALLCWLSTGQIGKTKDKREERYVTEEGPVPVTYENVLKFLMKYEAKFIAVTNVADMLVMFGPGVEITDEIICEDVVVENIVKQILDAKEITGRTTRIGSIDPLKTNALMLTPDDIRLPKIREMDVTPYDYAHELSFNRILYYYPWASMRTLDVRNTFKFTHNAGLYRLFAFPYVYHMPVGRPITNEIIELRRKVVEQHGIELQNHMEFLIGTKWEDPDVKMKKEMKEKFEDSTNTNSVSPVRLEWKYPVHVQELRMDSAWYKEASINPLPVPLHRNDVIVLMGEQQAEHMDGVWFVINCDDTTCTIASSIPVDEEHVSFIERKTPLQFFAEVPLSIVNTNTNMNVTMNIYVKEHDLLGELLHIDESRQVGVYLMKHMPSLDKEDYDNTGTCLSQPSELSKHRCKLWDKPCTHDTQCPFYSAGGERGGCTNGYCEMPLGTRRVGFRKYTGEPLYDGQPEPIFPMHHAFNMGLVQVQKDIKQA